jgi:hypothetical protein
MFINIICELTVYLFPTLHEQKYSSQPKNVKIIYEGKSPKERQFRMAGFTPFSLAIGWNLPELVFWVSIYKTAIFAFPSMIILKVLSHKNFNLFICSDKKYVLFVSALIVFTFSCKSFVLKLIVNVYVTSSK